MHRAISTLAYLLAKRLDEGATVEAGPYTIEVGLSGVSPIGNMNAFEDMG